MGLGGGKWEQLELQAPLWENFCPPLAVLHGLSCPLNEALVSPFSCWTAGLSEGLFVGVLLGMDLVIQILICQFISVVDLQLHTDAKRKRERKK